MTEINFYHLTVTTKTQALPRLLAKIYGLGHKLLLYTQDESVMKLYDELLWSFSTKVFLPHATMNDPIPEKQPLYLTNDPTDLKNKATILVCLDDNIPINIADFSKVIIMFEAATEASLDFYRKKWTELKSTSSEMTYWKQSPDGSWMKTA